MLGEGIEQRIPERSAFNAGDAIGEGLHFCGHGIELQVEGIDRPADGRCDDEEQDDAREELLEGDEIEDIGEGDGHGQDGDDEPDKFPGIGAEAIGFFEPGFDGFFCFDGQLRGLAMGLEFLPPDSLGSEFLDGFLLGKDSGFIGGVGKPMCQEGVALLGAGTVNELEDGGAAEDIEVIRVGVVFVEEGLAIGLMGELVVEEKQLLLVDLDEAFVFTDGLHIGLVLGDED